ncbi:MAG TPA: hypothetical protein VNT55_23870 [Baekduia sp.]|nr:hypothetical protein [Baekduia sp.]
MFIRNATAGAAQCTDQPRAVALSQPRWFSFDERQPAPRTTTTPRTERHLPSVPDPARTHWLKAIGHAKHPLPEAWLADKRHPTRLTHTAFPRKPRIAPGDRLVLYASVWKRVFGIAEVTSDPTPSGHERWPWHVSIEPLILIPHLENAPPVEAIGVAPRSMSQQSHVRLTSRQYALAVEALGAVAA